MGASPRATRLLLGNGSAVIRKSFVSWLALALTLAPAASAGAQSGPAPRPAGEDRVPNFLGATGLLLVPSADLQRDRQLSAHVAGTSGIVGGGILVGVRNRLEIGVTGVDADEEFAGGHHGTLANAKLNLFRETLKLPAVSVGVIDAFDALDRNPGWYVVASKYVIRYFVQGITGQDIALKLHLGYGGGIYDKELFTGAELFFRGHLAGLAEYANGEVNLGGRYHARHWAATIAVFDLEHLGGGIVYTSAFR
jgi:hypothetical protein